MTDPIIILGLGFTTQRLAERLLARGVSVCAAVRNPERFRHLEEAGVIILPLSGALPEGAVMVHSIPPLPVTENDAIHDLIEAAQPRRVLYISSTGVYGAQQEVDENTPAAPDTPQGRARIDEEKWLANTVKSCLILRSAAIYGPGRGIHVRLREGKLPRGAGTMVSRVHVDDLAALLEAGIDSPVEGAWPVADDQPAASEEVAAWCATLMNLRFPEGLTESFPVTGRKVDGSKLRTLLGVELKYPSYRSGIEASLVEEQRARNQ